MVVRFPASAEVVVMSGEVNGTVGSLGMVVDSTNPVVVMIGGGIVIMENGRSVVVKVGSDNGMLVDCSEGVSEVEVKFELSFSVVA